MFVGISYQIGFALSIYQTALMILLTFLINNFVFVTALALKMSTPFLFKTGF